MSSDAESKSTSEAPKRESTAGVKKDKMVCIRPWPKMIFLWPSAVFALFMAIANAFSPEPAASAAAGSEANPPAQRTTAEAADTDAAAADAGRQEPPAAGSRLRYVWGAAFLIVFALNIMVLTFEFPRATSLTLTFAAIGVVLALMLVNHQFNIIEPLKHAVGSLEIYASTQFYVFFFIINVILFIAMFVVTRFDYWELTHNELVHHHGILSDVERFSTAGLKLNKEITDIFEYLLCGAGTIVITVPGTPRPVVLENVLQISKVERLSIDILSRKVVTIDQPMSGPSDDSTPFQEAETG